MLQRLLLELARFARVTRRVLKCRSLVQGNTKTEIRECQTNIDWIVYMVIAGKKDLCSFMVELYSHF